MLKAGPKHAVPLGSCGVRDSLDHPSNAMSPWTTPALLGVSWAAAGDSPCSGDPVVMGWNRVSLQHRALEKGRNWGWVCGREEGEFSTLRMRQKAETDMEQV